MDTPEVYSPDKTRNLIQGAATFRQFPGGEYIAELAAQLKLSETYAKGEQDKLVDMKIELRRLKTDLDSLEARYREVTQNCNALEVLVKRVAEGEKNPRKLVQEYLNPTKSKNVATPPAHY